MSVWRIGDGMALQFESGPGDPMRGKSKGQGKVVFFLVRVKKALLIFYDRTGMIPVLS
jgi:hypothetical protein